MDKIPFPDWVYQQLEECGAIRNYDKTPHTGKGRSPKGNLSVQIARITELRNNPKTGDQLWGLIAYLGLQAGGEIGKKMTTVVKEFSQRANSENPDKLYSAIQMAAKRGHEQFKLRYKEKVCEVLEPSIT